jgi:carboxypeptidase Taq
MPTEVSELRERLAELTDLACAGRLLDWDQQTQMPARGGGARADQLATLHRITHEMFISDETGRLLDRAAGALNGADPDGDDARIVNVVRRDWEKARRVPSELAAEMAHAGSIGQEAWVIARRDSDFKAFAPYLKRNLELKRRYVDCFDSFPGFDCAYDVLLDDFEVGMKTAEVAALFEQLKAELVPMIAAVAEAEKVDDSCLHGSFPVARQRELIERVLERMGFDRDSWRLDDAVHPFATSFSSRDVRITTRWDETFYASALYGAMHECGHGLYEAGVADSLQRTPLGTGTSLGLHESQSRMWENMVGRGSHFTRFLAGLVFETFGDPVEASVLYRAVNRVEPSFIRVEADEATYGLHIVLRFEIEQELIEGRIAVDDLPEAWNSRFRDYFGLEVKDDAEGVLQDVHWSGGAIGYFPTYALGNLVAGQLWEKVHADLPDLPDALAAGELSSLREWLREHVHRHGSKFSTREIVQRVAGEPIAVAPFVGYLKRKLTDVYGI